MPISLLKKIGFLPNSEKPTRYCPICEREDISFLPLPDFYRENAKKYGYAHFGKGEMTAHDTYSCSNCGASDRERLYGYWMRAEIKKGSLHKDMQAIHFAPEAGLSNLIQGKNWFGCYHTADLMMESTDFKVDLMQLPFSDNSYDFFICSHILEHVEDDTKAMRELYRILKPGGKGILMAPISTVLDHTLEDPTITSAEERWRYFGQYDHVRLYAHDDYVRRIQSSGLYLDELGQKYFGKKSFSQLGLKQTSVLYVVSK